jgi:hypothetical protein
MNCAAVRNLLRSFSLPFLAVGTAVCIETVRRRRRSYKFCNFEQPSGVPFQREPPLSQTSTRNILLLVSSDIPQMTRI